GLTTPVEALAGFSNPAVVTVWAVFILSGGLTRTGVANMIGRLVLGLSGRSECLLVVVIMVCAGVMSAIMNNVAVAELMMPVVMDIARGTGTPASRLLMPLAYGSLLGGLTTQIGTPPNILVSEALRDNGLKPFTLFDFTPVGLAVFVAGTAFTAWFGRRLLPANDLQHTSKQKSLSEQYQIEDHLPRLGVPSRSMLVGKSIAESRIGTILGVSVVGISRRGRIIAAPAPSEIIQAEDGLIVESRGGTRGLKEELYSLGQLENEPESAFFDHLMTDKVVLAEISLGSQTGIAGQTIRQLDLRRRFGINVLAVRRGSSIQRARLQDRLLDIGDTLLVQTPRDNLENLRRREEFHQLQTVSSDALFESYHLDKRILALRVHTGSRLIGRTLKESRLGASLGIGVVALRRDRQVLPMPDPATSLQAEDLLLVTGRPGDLDTIQALTQCRVTPARPHELKALESADVGLVEAALSPHTSLAGKTLQEMQFREKYGLTVLAVWREGRIYRAEELRDMAIRFGDAMLLHGSRANFAR
ncbi:MAG TPA: SLC13 family permease, partial [Desulfosarcina sp.]|nr:SLC13 family permease [Desulfosarcina sp.]